MELVLASFAVLFQELALIRWIPVEVRVAAYFPNLILIGAFLGLGVGALRARGRSLAWLWPVSLLTLVGSAWLLSGVAFTAEGVTEHLWLLYDDLPQDAPVVNGIHLPLVLIFVLASLTFVPLGQFVGSRLEVFRRRSSTLWGYSFDLGGSLLGVMGFAALSWSGVKPVFWLLPPLVAGLVVVAGRGRRTLALHLGASLLILAAVHASTGDRRFSPYYALSAEPDPFGDVVIQANGSLHQVAIDMVSGEGSAARLQASREYRDPYRILGRPIRKALVLGAGTGNDVAVLLEMGAEEIHAVEIDPEILRMGRELHPNDPYADPRVRVHNTDARSFLNESPERFDVITFGTLDSMTRLSALSNVRLDNYVYTQECLAAARERLTEDGALFLFFMVGKPHIAENLAGMLALTFQEHPRIYRAQNTLFNTVFMAGPAFSRAGGEPVFGDAEVARRLLPSDDWPFLYLQGRGVNPFYLSMMATIAALGALAILSVSREMRESVRKGRAVDVEMFLYGFAFLLMETKFVTSMNLLWGATWLTSAVVFGSILAVVLAGTVFNQLRPVSWPLAGAGLVLALLATYALPLRYLLSTSPGFRLLLSVLLVGVPILFASLCFAARFKARPAADLAFGWNLLGAVVGGLAEFLSMWLGGKAMVLLAILAYLGAFLTARRSGPGTGPGGKTDPAVA